MIRFFRKIFSTSKRGPLIPPRLDGEQFYEPRWMWDVYKTGYPPPVKSENIEAFEREIRNIGQDRVVVTASLYDEIKKYLDDLDLHTGRAKSRNEVIAFYTATGRVELVRGFEGQAIDPQFALTPAPLSDSESPEPPPEKAYVNRSDRTALEFGKKG